VNVSNGSSYEQRNDLIYFCVYLDEDEFPDSGQLDVWTGARRPAKKRSPQQDGKQER
jgi:hypothetical protein